MIHLVRKMGSTEGQGARGNIKTIQGPNGENRSKLYCQKAMRVDADDLPR